MSRCWALRAVFEVFVWKSIGKIKEKNQKKLSKKSYNFPPVGPNMAIFGQVIGKKETKNL